jgi:glycosyltransferase involved in cell wall biosynthesis
MNQPPTPYTKEFYDSISDEIPQAKALAAAIKQLFNPRFMYDVGCGTGLYLRELDAVGIYTIGIDSELAARQNALPGVSILSADLVGDWGNPDKRDLCLCLETLEHIPEVNADEAIKNLTSLSDTIIFSAAQPGQGGVNHINCQEKDYWRRKFTDVHFTMDQEKTEELLAIMTAGPHMGWLANNLMVMVRTKCGDVVYPDGIVRRCPDAVEKPKYRFHLLGLAHVPTSPEICSCAYSQKVVKLARMLKSLGHTVTFYGGEGSKVECDEFVPVVSDKVRRVAYGDYDWRKEFFKHDPGDYAHRTFNTNAIAEINKRKQEHDFLLCPMGNYDKPIVDGVDLRMTVESGIGYTGVFSDYKVFESYAWMNHVYGLWAGWHDKWPDDPIVKKIGCSNGNWYDSVIPNYYDPSEFHLSPKGDYYLYIGRLISRKGLHIACQVTEKIGAKLIVAGQGDMKNVDGMDLARYKHVEHVGTVDARRRAALMAGAVATFVPTLYIAPFEGVHVESQLCGTPVITTDWGVFSETVTNGVNGFRCRTFADFIEASEKVKGLDAGKIRAEAVSHYSMDVVAQQYQTYFDRLNDIWDKGWYQEPREKSFAPTT